MAQAPTQSRFGRKAAHTAWEPDGRTCGRYPPPASRASSAGVTGLSRPSPRRSSGGGFAIRVRVRGHDLVEGLVVGDHAQIRARALLECAKAALQIAHLGSKLAVA